MKSQTRVGKRRDSEFENVAKCLDICCRPHACCCCLCWFAGDVVALACVAVADAVAVVVAIAWLEGVA